MATIVELPRLSDTMEEGVVAAWRIAVGDKVKRGQVIAEIETDKATMEFESFDAGVVLKLVADTGAVLPIGAPIAVFGKEGEDPSEALAAHGGGASGGDKPAAPRDERAPAEVAKAESAEAAPAPAKAAPEKAAPAKAAPAKAAPQSSADERIPASPIARRLARESGLSLSQIQGSGPHGRVVKADVEAAAAGGSGQLAGGSFSSETDVFGRPYISREDQIAAPTLMRRTIAKRMVQSQQQIPHFYLTIEVEMNAAAKLRSELNASVDGTKVSFNDLVIAAAAAALRKHPECNVSWSEEGAVMHGDIDIGMAVAVEGGLVVPVIRNAEQKSLVALSRETRNLGKRAKDKKLDPKEMTGSSFSVSNLGMFGIDEFAAMVNPGEGAILAVGAVADGPAVREGELVIRKLMRATLSCDHRVIDGAMGAKFLATFKALLEQPMRLFAAG